MEEKANKKDFLSYIASSVLFTEYETMLNCYEALDKFFLKKKCISTSLLEISDLNKIQFLKKKIEDNRIFRITHWETIDDMIYALSLYEDFVSKKEKGHNAQLNEDRADISPLEKRVKDVLEAESEKNKFGVPIDIIKKSVYEIDEQTVENILKRAKWASCYFDKYFYVNINETVPEKSKSSTKEKDAEKQFEKKNKLPILDSPKYRDNTILFLITKLKMSYNDCRNKQGGTIWIIGSSTISEKISLLLDDGYRFIFDKNGSADTLGLPAWYLYDYIMQEQKQSFCDKDGLTEESTLEQEQLIDLKEKEKKQYVLRTKRDIFYGDTPSLAILPYIKKIAKDKPKWFTAIIGLYSQSLGKVVLHYAATSKNSPSVGRAYLDENLNSDTALDFAKWIAEKCSYSDLSESLSCENIVIVTSKKPVIDTADQNREPQTYSDKTLASFADRQKNIEKRTDGVFSSHDKQKRFSIDSNLISKYKESYDLLGAELVSACFNRPAEIMSLISALSSFSCKVDHLYEQKNDVKMMICDLPDNKKNNRIIGYINAYTSDENEQTSLLHMLQNSECTFRSLLINENLSYTECIKLNNFLKWCSFDIKDDLKHLFDKLHAKNNMRIVIQNRAIRKTLEQIGTELGVSRERIRQIEAKAKKIFAQWQRSYRIELKISAERNGDTILTPTEIEGLCGKYATELMYFLKSFESSSYTYDSQLDVFIVENGSVSERLQEYIENLPDIFNKSSLPDIYNMAEECKDIPQELIERAILDEYKLAGNTYHRCRLSLSKMYSFVLDKYYPNGIKAYDEAELSIFRKHIIETYGNVNIPVNNRAITSRITKIGILCGKGMYKLKTDKYISKALSVKIHDYIIHSNRSILMINTLFLAFQDELTAEGINNKYYLQGILHELYGNKFAFHRDYVSKDETFTSLYSEIVRFIMQSDYPVSKKQLQVAFPGVTEIVFSLSVSDPNVLNFFGQYLHASKLKISFDEKNFLFHVVDKIISDNCAHHCKEAFDLIMKDRPEILLRNAATQPFCAYSILECLFKKEFKFSRPYIAKQGIDIGRPGERLHDMIYSSDEVSISDIYDFEKENRYKITSLLDFLISLNNDYLIANDNSLISISSSGITSEVANAIEDEICIEVSDATPIYQLQCAEKFPKINIPWTDWLVFSTLKKWSNRLDVGVSNKQFKYASPLVSQRGKMDEKQFISFEKKQNSLALADNLDNIDELIAGYIENEVIL